MVFDENITKILDTYFASGGNISANHQLVKHQIDSYNDFIENKLRKIVSGYNPIKITNDQNSINDYKNKNVEKVFNNDFKQKILIYIEEPHFTKPIYKKQDGTQITMTPQMARIDNLTYTCDLYVNATVITEIHNTIENHTETKTKKLNDIYIGKLPVMVGSKACILTIIPNETMNSECKYDMGGYFIVNGNEKVLINQDRIKENYVLIFKPANNIDIINTEIRSMNESLYLPTKTISLSMSKKSNHMGRVIRINTSFLKSEIPVFIMFRALGILSDNEIIHHIVYDLDKINNKDIIQELRACCDDASGIYTKMDALDYILKNVTGNLRNTKTIETVESVIDNDFIPHVTGKNKKALYLGHMINKAISVYLGYEPYDNRDSYINKRIDSPGMLMSNLFRQCYGKITKELKTMIEKDINQWRNDNSYVVDIVSDKQHITKYFKQGLLDSWLKYALSTGNWGIKTIGSFQNIKQGVSQVLNRMSHHSTLSHLRRINTAMEKNGKLIQPRKLDNSQYGVICACETPEGAPVGLVKNMAISTNISIYSCHVLIKQLLIENGVIEYTDDIEDKISYLQNINQKYNSLILLNGELFGYHKDPYNLYHKLRSFKRKGLIHPIASIYWDIMKNKLSISTEGGRMYRPLFIVDNGKELRFNKFLKKYGIDEISKWTFESYITPYIAGKDEEEGFIEYLDIDEMSHAMIAMFPNDLTKPQKGVTLNPNYTHCEIHPSLMFGILGANIPFANHNQAPRNTYQSAMGKQALGVYMTNFNSRMDTISNILNYPQKALISTKLSKYTHAAELPSGINAVVAIMTYSGFNQEDGIIVNRDALDRGLFVSTHYKTLKEQCNKNGSTGEEEIFCRPEECDRNKQFNYGKLNKEGFVDKNTAIQSGDIIVGKIMPKKIKTKIHKIDTSIAIKSNEEGIVDYNYSEINNEGYAFCKIRIRNHRKPAVGDKLASSIAQKASIGMIYNQEDMPYTKDGIVPDLIMNPHAIPSRMTIAQLMECVLGKVACVEGVTKDCTPYNNLSVKEICDQLELYGMERHSNEILYDGYTGRQIKTEIFIGPTYYQRLKHMVVDKMHSRSSNGPIVFLTRQPSEGRSRCGGLRLGEMERDAIVAHGSSLFLKERILDCSDNSRQTICKTCGFIITSNPDKNLYQCTACKNELEPSQIRIPYSFKLLIQELQCMNIGIRMSI
jgi:DNA-directed RNA polymerase II subunit RPB2